MKTLDKYLDQAKEITGSDYKTAQVLEMTRQGISTARKNGKMSNENAIKLAQLIDENPVFIIAASDIKTHPENEKTWQKWVAACLIIGTIGIAGTTGNTAFAEEINNQQVIDYAKLSCSKECCV